MPRVIEYPDEKYTVCKSCRCVIGYTPDDVRKNGIEDCPRGVVVYDGYRITCPRCANWIVVHEVKEK